MLLTRTLLVLFVFAAGAQAVSAAEAWRIVASTGVVTTGAPGVMPVAVNTKQALPVDSWVETGASGRIVLSRGVESIAVGPNSRVMLPALTVNGNTQVLQTVGTALYQIGKQKAPHFQVDTPYLAAVVKGTTFTVSVTEGAASVDVSEGLVAVATPDGADSADVQPGFTGYVQRGQRDKVVVVPTTDGPATGSSPKNGKSTAATHKETSNSKGRVVITAAIGEVALDVKSVSGGLAIGTDTATKGGVTKAASAVAGAASNAGDVVRDTESDNGSSTSGASYGASVDAPGASVSVDAGGGVASVDVSSNAGGVAAGVDVGGGNGNGNGVGVDAGVGAGSGGVTVGVGVGNGGVGVDLGAGGGGGVGGENGNGNGGLGVGVGAGSGGVTAGVGVGNGGVGIDLGLGAGGGLGLGLGLGGRGGS